MLFCCSVFYKSDNNRYATTAYSYGLSFDTQSTHDKKS